jgi:hypothetical protein
MTKWIQIAALGLGVSAAACVGSPNQSAKSPDPADASSSPPKDGGDANGKVAPDVTGEPPASGPAGANGVQ